MGSAPRWPAVRDAIAVKSGLRGRKDDNHDQIVARFRALGCTVLELVRSGIPGFPDLVVGCIGRTHLVEVKNLNTAYGRAGLNSNQTTFARDWRGEKPFAVTSEDEAIVLIQNWRKAK